jgi:coproporphyrinogen III oxidase-like Fe-S oxidoreductase
VEKRLGRIDHRREKQLYQQIAERMLAAGYNRSSAWCFSRQPAMIDEYIIDQDEYLGLGSGAFSYLGGHFYASTFSLNHYIDRAAAGLSGIVRERALSERDQMRYYLLTHLFAGCVDLDQADERFASRFRKVLWPELTALRRSGSVSELGSRLLLTDRGYYLWVVLMREFFTGVNLLRDDMRHHIAAERTPLH